MIPAPQIETAQYFEWDTPWSMGTLTVVGLFVVAWVVWQVLREGRITSGRWWILFLPLRLITLSTILWMILGPTTVLKQTETLPRTLAVYLDTSSSMQLQDPPEAADDLRWKFAADYRKHAVCAADTAALFAASLRQQTNQLERSVEQQWSTEERNEAAARWKTLALECKKHLSSDVLTAAITAEIKRPYAELLESLNTKLVAEMNDVSWLTGNDTGDREFKLQELVEQADQFAVRCRTIADLLANSSAGVSASPADLPTRFERVIPAIANGLTRWQAASNHPFRTRIAQFADSVSELPLDGWDVLVRNQEQAIDAKSTRRTDMTSLLKQIRDDAGKEEIVAAVIVTDGRHTVDTPDESRDLAAQLRLPLYVIPIGSGELKRDVLLHHVNAPTSVIEKDKISLEGIVTARRCTGESTELTLIENNRVIDTKQIVFKAEQDDQRFQFEVPTENVGRRIFTIKAAVLTDEQSDENNAKTLGVDVVDAKLRILLVDGRARWEHQYLVNLFNRQDSIEMDQLKFAPRPIGTGRRKADAELPQTVEEWNDYRIVVIGDIGPHQMSEQSQKSLREWVSVRGGSVILVAGQSDMPQAFEGQPLQQLLPVEADTDFSLDKQGYRVEMTIEGKASDPMQLGDDVASTERIWREAGTSMPIYYLSKYHRPKPNSQVFLSAVGLRTAAATTESPALLCWQTVGAGRVAYLSSPSTYQLRNQNGDTNHHRFWGQFIRWMVSRTALGGSKTAKLVADKSNYSSSDVAQLYVELSDPEGHPVTAAAPQIDVVKANEVVANIQLTADEKVPGRYFGTFASSEPQHYTLKLGGPDVDRLLKAEGYPGPVQLEIDFEPGLDRELTDTRSDRPLLEHLAEQTGGQVLPPTALSELPSAVSLDPRLRETSERTALWDRWWCLWVILGCSTVEWLIRKQIGLA